MNVAVDFPGSFLWGAATTAHQIEGSHDTDGRGPSVWDAFARRAGAIEGGGDASRATDSYRRWNEDLDILAELGLNAYRSPSAGPGSCRRAPAGWRAGASTTMSASSTACSSEASPRW